MDSGHGSFVDRDADRNQGADGRDRRSVMSLSDIDRGLLDRCLRGRARAWDDFVGRFAGLVICAVDHVAHSRGLLFAQDDRDDLVAEVFLEYLKDDMRVLRQFRGRSSLATYLSVVSRRTILRSLMNHRELIRPNGSSDGIESIPDRVEFQRQYEDREQVERLLTRLTENERLAISRYYLESFSYREIAEELQIRENSVGPLLSRALAKMRR